MTYSVRFLESEIPFSRRFDSYLDPGFFENNIHLFSIINSFAIALLLCGFVMGILLRTLKKDYAKYEVEELEPMDILDSVGWKQVSGDVFRPPPFLQVFAGLVGQGWHLNTLVLLDLSLSLIHPTYSERGSFAGMTIICYAVLGGLNGFITSYFYRLNNGSSPTGCAVFGSVFYPVFIAVVCLALNSLAIFYQSSAAIPFVTMVKIGILLLFVYLPLYTIGTLSGKRVF